MISVVVNIIVYILIHISREHINFLLLRADNYVIIFHFELNEVKDMYSCFSCFRKNSKVIKVTYQIPKLYF